MGWFEKIDFKFKKKIQVIMTAEKFCPMIFDNISRVEIPMVLIEVQAALEAALFARCRFYTELVELDDKIKDLVCKSMLLERFFLNIRSNHFYHKKLILSCVFSQIS